MVINNLMINRKIITLQSYLIIYLISFSVE